MEQQNTFKIVWFLQPFFIALSPIINMFACNYQIIGFFEILFSITIVFNCYFGMDLPLLKDSN